MYFHTFGIRKIPVCEPQEVAVRLCPNMAQSNKFQAGMFAFNLAAKFLYQKYANLYI
jgi:hypothetical protein